MKVIWALNYFGENHLPYLVKRIYFSIRLSFLSVRSVYRVLGALCSFHNNACTFTYSIFCRRQNKYVQLIFSYVRVSRDWWYRDWWFRSKGIDRYTGNYGQCYISENSAFGRRYNLNREKITSRLNCITLINLFTHIFDCQLSSNLNTKCESRILYGNGE